MDNSLNKDSGMECPRHGLRKPAFVCHHLQYGVGLGFVEVAAEDIDPDFPFKNAWCEQCERVRLEQDGEWNDVSEGFAKPMAVCEGCYEDIKTRNSSNT